MNSEILKVDVEPTNSDPLISPRRKPQLRPRKSVLKEQPQQYSCFCFCCRCFLKKGNSSINESTRITFKFFSPANNQEANEGLPEIFRSLLKLHSMNKSELQNVITELKNCRINPNFHPNAKVRNDLEFYIPQLTYKPNEQFVLKKACLLKQCYGYPMSRVETILYDIIDAWGHIKNENIFHKYYSEFYAQDMHKVEASGSIISREERISCVEDLIHTYQADDINQIDESVKIRASDLKLENYLPVFNDADSYNESSGFLSNIRFFEDLYAVSEAVSASSDRIYTLKQKLNEMNRHLPSAVYIPFTKASLRHHAVLHICVEESKVFSTKERAPFYICMELFRPDEDLQQEIAENLGERRTSDNVFKKLFKSWKIFSNINNQSQNPDFLSQDIKLSQALTIENEKYKRAINSLVKTDEASPFRVHSYTWASRSVLSAPKNEEEKSLNSAKKVVPSQDRTNFGLSLPNCGSTNATSEKEKEDLKGKEIQIDDETEVGGEKEKMNGVQNKSSEKEDAKEREEEEKTIYDQRANHLEHDPKGVANDRGLSLAYEDPSIFNGGPRKISQSHSANIPHHRPVSISPVPEMKRQVSANAPDAQTPLISSNDDDYDLYSQDIDPYFGEDTNAQTRRIKEGSIFKHLSSWRLAHMVVKGGADLKEEQFAVQLIQQFDQIFKKEKIDLILTPIEIISLDMDFGLVEMVKDSITLSSLKEKLYAKGIGSLRQFFDSYYGRKADKAKENFCGSLAAYSVVCYFLQIKDRHNGNILLHKSGKIAHLDFGFFLSNAPGKGLNFESSVPFKLLTEYVEVLGGVRSNLFQKFRKLFYKGFRAAQKNKDQILALVKMMYSSHGVNLPCFKYGDRAITDLEERFVPRNVITEGDLKSYCHTLINMSLDNWRASCYDKYQYYMQGIFY